MSRLEQDIERGAYTSAIVDKPTVVKHKRVSWLDRFLASDTPTDEDRCGEIKE